MCWLYAKDLLALSLLLSLSLSLSLWCVPVYAAMRVFFALHRIYAYVSPRCFLCICPYAYFVYLKMCYAHAFEYAHANVYIICALRMRVRMRACLGGSCWTCAR